MKQREIEKKTAWGGWGGGQGKGQSWVGSLPMVGGGAGGASGGPFGTGDVRDSLGIGTKMGLGPPRPPPPPAHLGLPLPPSLRGVFLVVFVVQVVQEIIRLQDALGKGRGVMAGPERGEPGGREGGLGTESTSTPILGPESTSPQILGQTSPSPDFWSQNLPSPEFWGQNFGVRISPNPNFGARISFNLNFRA